MPTRIPTLRSMRWSMLRSPRTVLPLLLSAVIACGTDAPSSGASDTSAQDTSTQDTTTADTDGADTTIPADWRACSADSECVAVELACCDHCNGGKLDAYHTDHVLDAAALVGPKGCQGVACTAMGCAKAIAWCEQGVCTAGLDPGFGGCSKLGEADCAKSADCTPLNAMAPAAVCANVSAKPVFQGCGPAGVGCGGALTCAQSGKDDSYWVFPSTCVAEGFQVKDYSACCVDPGDTCAAGGALPIGRICVRGADGSGTLVADAKVELVVYPKGCMSSSCTKVHSASCALAAEDKGGIAATAQICVENTTTPGGACIADCNGGGFAKCETAALKAGSYSIKIDALTLPFTVPSSSAEPPCVGSQWE